eukprot:jgi/Mesvir1/23530/Mv18231-RA.1
MAMGTDFSASQKDHIRRESYPEPASDSMIYCSEEARARYEAYSKLQASAVAFGESLPIPEIVTIGGQSDGKSSLLEAFLGFRFNIRDVEMGTRRPLTLQMIHDPTAQEPRCCLQNEDSDEYGPPIVPASSVSDCIRQRTETHLRKLGTAVSAKPIVMRVEYAFCPNLTVVDTPGFVLKAKPGEPESTPDDIRNMVKELVAPPHRLILFLQQSSVEWCSSLWLHVVQEVDPTFRRTVMVASKFDNRLKEFSERWEIDRYLTASGILGANRTPFFVALPKERGPCANEDFRAQILATDKEILRQMRDEINGGFDEERFKPWVGFGALRRFLEADLQRRYREAAPSTLAILDARYAESQNGLVALQARLASASDVASLRTAAMSYTWQIMQMVSQLMAGAAQADPAAYGQTTAEERSLSSSLGVAGSRWPGVAGDVVPPNAHLRLYGGAAFERVLAEFQSAALSLSFPPISKEKVANMLLAQSGRMGGGVAATAASIEIARSSAKTWIAPLLDTACDRLAYVLRRLYGVAVECVQAQGGDDCGCMAPYVAFHAELQRAYEGFIADAASHCRRMAHHHLTTATGPFAPQGHMWAMSMGPSGGMGGFGYEGGMGGFAGTNGGLTFDFCSQEEGKGGDIAAAQQQQQQQQHLHGRQQQGKKAKKPGHKEENDENYSGAANGVNSPAIRPPKAAAKPLGAAGTGHGSILGDPVMIRESQMTVPETPSPEQEDCHEGRRADYGLASGRLSLDELADSVAEGSTRKRIGDAMTGGHGQQMKQPFPVRGAFGAGGVGASSGSSLYEHVCGEASRQFAAIRGMVAQQEVPSTLRAGFFTECADKLPMAVSLKLFARSDASFMEMFTGVHVIEAMEAQRGAMVKRCEMLAKHIEEFRNLARCL